MNVFVIPSWYPSNDYPSTGIFFKEQTQLLARNHPKINFGLSVWGSHEENLLLHFRDGLKVLQKLSLNKPQKCANQLAHNCIEYYNPAYTWTRKILHGNIGGIIKANWHNFHGYQNQFGRVDLIQAHVSYPAGYVAMKMAKKAQHPYIITEHMSPFPFETFIKNNKQISPLVREPLELANRVITVSSFLKEKIQQSINPSIEVVPNFIDENLFTPNTKQVSEMTFLSIGRIEPQKNHNGLLQALKILSNNSIRFKALMVGGGHLMDELKNQSTQLQIEGRIKWYGELNRTDVANLIRASNAVILNSNHENNPVALIEALACGKPIIATSCGGPEDIVNDNNGLLVNVNDSIDLAEKMIQLMKTYDEYNQRVIRSDFEERFSSKVITPKIVKIYQQVIHEYSNQVSGRNE